MSVMEVIKVHQYNYSQENIYSFNFDILEFTRRQISSESSRKILFWVLLAYILVTLFISQIPKARIDDFLSLN